MRGTLCDDHTTDNVTVLNKVIVLYQHKDCILISARSHRVNGDRVSGKKHRAQ